MVLKALAAGAAFSGALGSGVFTLFPIFFLGSLRSLYFFAVRNNTQTGAQPIFSSTPELPFPTPIFQEFVRATYWEGGRCVATGGWFLGSARKALMTIFFCPTWI